MAFTIKRVRLTDQNKKLLAWMDSECFPSDDPLDTSGAQWWIAYDEEGHPVAYAGLKGGYLNRSGVLPVARGHGLQKRLISVRERYARVKGESVLITDTVINPAFVNSLINKGFRMYQPAHPWTVGSQCLYWQKELK